MKNESSHIVEFILNGSLSGFGAAASYLYHYQKRTIRFSAKTLFISVILGFFLGIVVVGFIPKDAFYRDGLLLMIGFCFNPILGILEKKLPDVLDGYIDKRIVINKKDEHIKIDKQ